MEELACPRCKTTKYRNPSLKLMVNACGHTLCELCVDLLFLKGSGSCPECKVPLRRNHFRVQLFEDPMVEKEMDIRRRILRDYNKHLDDFKTVREYNDYLEEIETIVHNLCNNIDVIGTNKRIEAYKRDNREIILRNKRRVGREEYLIDEMIELERAQEEARRKELVVLETEQVTQKTRVKEELIEQLSKGENVAADVVHKFAERAEKLRDEEKTVPPPKPINQGPPPGVIKYHRKGSYFLPVPKVDQGVPFKRKILVQITDGPKPPSIRQIEAGRYRLNMRRERAAERAGGYRWPIGCQRALQDALQGLYPMPKPVKTDETPKVE